jgi:hypothetical protein
VAVTSQLFMTDRIDAPVKAKKASGPNSLVDPMLAEP